MYTGYQLYLSLSIWLINMIKDQFFLRIFIELSVQKYYRDLFRTMGNLEEMGVRK